MMRENELQVDSTGVWLKTRRENVQLWRSLFNEVLKLHGYQLLNSTPYKDTYHVTSLHHRVHAFTSFESLIINIFTNGHFHIETENKEKFFKHILPHIEHTLDVKFKPSTSGKERNINVPVAAYFNRREGPLPPIGLQVQRRAEVAKEVTHRADVDDVAYGRMENQIANAREELLKAKNALSHVDEKLTDVSSDLLVFNETRRDNLRACVGLPASYPSIGPESYPTMGPSSYSSVGPAELPLVKRAASYSSIRPASHPSIGHVSHPSSRPESHASVEAASYTSIRPASHPSNEVASYTSIRPVSHPSVEAASCPSIRAGSHPSVGPAPRRSVEFAELPLVKREIAPESKVCPSTAPTKLPRVKRKVKKVPKIKYY